MEIMKLYYIFTNNLELDDLESNVGNGIDSTKIELIENRIELN